MEVQEDTWCPERMKKKKKPKRMTLADDSFRLILFQARTLMKVYSLLTTKQNS